MALSRKKKIWIILIGSLLLVWFVLILILSIAYHVGNKDAVAEWESKFPQEKRIAAEIRGLVDNMVRLRYQNVPAFVPQYLWDKEMCAANVVNATNMILGEERLKSVAAWKFSRVNKKHLHKVYDRSSDFRIKGNRIVEIRERNFWLSRILQTSGHGQALTSDRLYIVGYHYGFTRSDSKIIAAKQDLNSHLMLLLGRYDGRWWGYHLYHDPEKPKANPFRIDDLGSCEDRKCMPNSFDVVYIWEVKNSRLAEKGQGKNIAFVQKSPTFREVDHFLGWLGKGSVGRFMDIALNKLFSSGEHYPQAVDLSQDVVFVRESNHRFGRILGFYQGIEIRYNRGKSRRGQHGFEYQCVEFVNRFYAKRLGHYNMTQSGHAVSYFIKASVKGLIAYPNGSRVKPRVHDILTFHSGRRGDYGHVAIVYKVTGRRICIVQQNRLPWRECLRLHHKNGRWYVGRLSYYRQVIGWSRKK